MDAEKFSSYFYNCPIVVVPTFEVETSYLDDILAETNYESEEMKDSANALGNVDIEAASSSIEMYVL